MHRLFITLVAALFALPAWAEPPKVLATIKPIHSLVAGVMEDIAEPDLLLDGATSPHNAQIKPSQGKMLDDADVIFWVGEDLEVGFSRTLGALSQEAEIIALMDSEGLDLIDLGDGHADPHIWLSPTNAKILAKRIEDTLVRLDPDNAEIYARNGRATRGRLTVLDRKIKTLVKDENLQGQPFVVQHDGLGYLLRDYGLNQVGALANHEGHTPGAQHLSHLRQDIQASGAKCLFTEPQMESANVKAFAQELGLKTSEIDIIGADLTASRTAYQRMMQKIFINLLKCLNG